MCHTCLYSQLMTICLIKFVAFVTQSFIFAFLGLEKRRTVENPRQKSIKKDFIFYLEKFLYTSALIGKDGFSTFGAKGEKSRRNFSLEVDFYYLRTQAVGRKKAQGRGGKPHAFVYPFHVVYAG